MMCALQSECEYIINNSLQTGITVKCVYDVHHRKTHKSHLLTQPGVIRTVDSNSHALAEHIAIGALKRGDLAELVELEVVGAHALGGLGVHALELEAIGLGDGEDGGRAWVVLGRYMSAMVH
jgi:hypothetical protein